MLKLQEFEILNTIFKSNKEKITQRKLSNITNISLGKVNSTLKTLKEKKFIDDNFNITDLGFSSMEPYKVDNAIIMAAGMSSRFAPLSYEKPKGLLNVKGERLIERQILQLQQAGITDITIVVGYMKEKMFYLAEKFNVNIIVNEDYYKFNNPSSLILVTEKLNNTYICSSDNYFTINPFEKYVYRAYYSVVYDKGETNEYCVTFDKKNKITSAIVGGSDCWYMLGHVFFDKNFSKKFVEILKREYSKPKVCENLWEDLYISHIKELDMYIRKYKIDEIKEFDSIDELRTFDEKYISDSNSTIFKNICKTLKCNENEIQAIEPLKLGMTNLSFKFDVYDKSYVYRHPGVGTENYINRKSEKLSMEIAKQIELDNTYIYMDENEGWKISKYLKGAKNLSYDDDKNIDLAISMLRKLHKSQLKTGYEFDIFEVIEKFKHIISLTGRDDFEDINKLSDMIKRIEYFVKKDDIKNCLCHCDSYNLNFLLDNDENIYLIDWEYSAMSDPAIDIGTFIGCSDYTFEQASDLIKKYLKDEYTKEKFRHFIAYVAVSSFYWFLWAIMQEINGKNIGKYLYIWYRYTKLYAKKALEMYEN